MGKVILDMAMSLDGFIAGPNDESGGLHNWFFSPSGDSAEVVAESIETTGTLILGRRSYDIGAAQDGFADNPYQAPHFVVTHAAPEKTAKGAESFSFVTGGIKSALEQAKAAAGDKNVVIGGGANIAQQYLKAGFVDEIQLHLVPVLLHNGIRLFEYIGPEQIKLENARVIESPGVTHLRYQAVK